MADFVLGSTLHFADAVNTRPKITVHINNLVSSEFPNRSNRSAKSFISTLNCTYETGGHYYKIKHFSTEFEYFTPKWLTHIKQGLQKYCETAYSRSGVNQMWILKNSKELLEHLKSPNFNNITSIKSFDFSTLYRTIPHDKLKSRLASIIRNSFMFKNGNRRHKYLVLGHEESYFVKEHSDSKHKYSEDDIIKMLELGCLSNGVYILVEVSIYISTTW